jgi:diguanylate cyclase (GGDEF)-like protein
LISAAALHPSMLDTVRRKTSGPATDDGRFVLIAVSLLTPALMMFVWSPSTMLERGVVGSLAVVLATAAIVRVVLAARAQAAVEQRLERQATTDELTGLINRPAALELVNRQLDTARADRTPVALLFIDLDRFKLVNDSYGHAVGDDLLLAAADRLRTSVGTRDTVARLSGDEFLVAMPATDIVRAREVASRICEVFAEPFQLIGTAWVTVSVGVVVATDVDDADATMLIRDADTAMYEAKAAGRGGFVMFNPAMRAASERQLEIYNGLHRAIERDEFEVYYQVIIDAASGTVHGVEALLRWESPTGMVPPDQFISLAEDSGLISTIGEIVLTRACDQVARWRKLPGCDDLTLSVNVSARQILDGDIVALVDDVLTASGLEPESLWLEITESVMMADTLETAAALAGLRALGVHLSVDDFGTGNSSLSYLQRFPIEQVKIDRQFVAGMGEHTEDAAVVAAVIGIAQALSLSIVAEGVETAEQERRLAHLGCGLLQGFLYSRPVPAIDLGPILMERNQFQLPPSSGFRRR